MYTTLIKDIILWGGWIFNIAITIYILLRGKVVLKLVKGSIIGKLAMGLMIGFFIESYSVLFLCSALIMSSDQSVNIVLPVFIIWFFTFVYCWKVMHKTRVDAEKIVGIK